MERKGVAAVSNFTSILCFIRVRSILLILTELIVTLQSKTSRSFSVPYRRKEHRFEVMTLISRNMVVCCSCRERSLGLRPDEVRPWEPMYGWGSHAVALAWAGANLQHIQCAKNQIKWHVNWKRWTLRICFHEQKYSWNPILGRRSQLIYRHMYARRKSSLSGFMSECRFSSQMARRTSLGQKDWFIEWD